jgi:RNA polymerase sigma factor (sigma-70 family)
MTQLRGTSLLRHIRKVVAAQSPSRQSDRQLVQQFIAERDEAAFAALVQRHGPMVLGVCRNVLHHQQDAEDVFQAVFLVLARKPHSIRKQQSLSSWLHGVAYRLALKARARRSRRQDRERPAAECAAGTGDDLTVRELSAILHAELQRLPEDQRSPLLLCYWEGKTRDEAAEVLGMTAGAFKKRLERARRVLGSRLTRRGLVPSVALFAMLFTENGVKGAVSGSLIRSTTQAAVAFAAGKSALATATAAALAEGAIRAMNLTKWATSLLTVMFLSAATATLGLVGYQALYGGEPDGLVQAFATQAQGKDKAAGQKPDAERILGTWRVASGLHDGQEVPKEFVVLARLKFTKDGAVEVTVLDNSSPGKYKLVGPGKIDLSLNPREELQPGIYKFDGNDRLTICAGKDGDQPQRPKEFTADKGAGNVLLTLTRAKPGEEKPTAEEIAKFADPAERIKEAAARQQSANNMKQIGLAMHNYADVYKGLPLHAIYSKDGKTPLLSWRVAILPFIEQQPLYQEFKLDEPWDSAHNKKLIAKMPQIYEMPIGKNKEGMTYYQVITGPGTVFDGDKKLQFQDITNGTSNTILAVEAKDPVIWTKPADLTMPKDKDKLPALGGHFRNGFHILMADGSVRMMAANAPVQVFRSAVSPKSGE